MRVMKFGGSSVRDYDRIATAGGLVRDALEESEVAVVVSALGGVTDQLLEIARLAQRGDRSYQGLFQALAGRHFAVVDRLEQEGDRGGVRPRIGECLGELELLLSGVSLVHECSPRTLDKILSSGERMSAHLMAAMLRRLGVEAEACDARGLVVTDGTFGNAAVEIEPTYARIRAHFARTREATVLPSGTAVEIGSTPPACRDTPDPSGAPRASTPPSLDDAPARRPHHPVQVVTGFIASTEDGETTTLGRGGSDYTASLLGAALGAERVEIWTDVDGVLSADPRRVEGAFSLQRLSYDELLELSHFGAKVVYPPTVHPARKAAIPLLIRNTLNPSFPGTVVVEQTGPSESPIRGISSISRIALLRLEGDGMIEVPGTAGRLFRALGEAGINVILISQASSEHSICLAVDPLRAGHARDIVDREFARERAAGLVDPLVVDEDVSILAVVGVEMNQRPGISGRVFGALGAAGVNVRAIAQGSSELNISLAVAAADERRALATIHDAFFDPTRLHLFLLGAGTVGGELLRQLRDAPAAADWSLSGIANSRRMSLERRRRERARWSGALLDAAGAIDTDLASLSAFVRDAVGPRVLVDCTASAAVVDLYVDLLAAGVDVVTANKKPVAADQSSWQRLLDAQSRPGSGRLYYEATVGAGLPVVRTLADQVATGDRVLRIEGLFSGTLAFLLWRLRQGASFSAALAEARERGLTEPDVREDLSGQDVARKLLILARLAGARLDLGEIGVTSLLPEDEAWWKADAEEVWRRLPELDASFAELVAASAREGRIPAYLAAFVDGRATVGIERVAPDHPAASAIGTENLFAFTTERYRERPLVVRGPGAGPQVTAAGIFSDLLLVAADGKRR
ncbi:MAG TPA: bifunctional aspartate kinase/homoserine dehydrogenase I, partial [Thermoanaerobaculia bacterium]|nr:bifunctional aspartate kinase/homoserine dehydrogenase I [Thermoanaerobaculia bacterium]